MQYWRSFAHLEAFAKDRDDPHLDAWRHYWRRVGRDDRTGIWHETLLVGAGEYEAVYGKALFVELGGIEPPRGFARRAWSERCAPGQGWFSSVRC